MRVLYISSVYKPAYVYGGPARSVPSLCEGLAHAGADIEVFTTNANRPGRLDVPLGRRMFVDGVPVTYFPVVAARYFYAPALVDAVREKITKFDVVEIDALFTALFGPLVSICRNARIPYVVPPRGQLLPWALREKWWKKRLYLRLTGLSALNRAAAIHCTDGVEADALAPAGVDAPTFVVPNALTIRQASPAPSGHLVRALLGIPESAGLLLFVGRFHRVKRLDVAVAILDANRNAHLLLVGPDEENLAPSLRKQARLSGCEGRLHFLPLQSGDSLERIYAAADLFVLPSEMESFGMAAAEAMAAGLPVLVSDKVPIGRRAQAAKAGVVASNRVDEFARAAADIFALPRERLREMGARAKQCAATCFDREAVARMFLDQLAGLCPARGGPQN